MPVSLHAESAEAFVQELHVLIFGIAGLAAANRPQPAETNGAIDLATETAVVAFAEREAVAAAEPPPAEPVAEAKPKARRKKPEADVVAETLAAVAEVEPELVAAVVEDHGLPASDDVGATPVLTRDDVAAALRALAATGAHGALKSRDVIYSIGAKRISDIPEDRFAGVLAAAKREHDVIDAMSPAEREAANTAASQAGA